jgi:hypothetical protein
MTDSVIDSLAATLQRIYEVRDKVIVKKEDIVNGLKELRSEGEFDETISERDLGDSSVVKMRLRDKFVNK